MQKVFSLVKKTAPCDVTVLISGETGTGKEMVARAVHQTSPRHRQRFVHRPRAVGVHHDFDIRADGLARDLDWYKIALPAKAVVNWTVRADFPVSIFAFNLTGGCNALSGLRVDGRGDHLRADEDHELGTIARRAPPREQIADLGIDRDRVVERGVRRVTIEIVLRLLRHRERTGNRDLDRTRRVAAQELDVFDLNRVLAADLADNARHFCRMPRSIHRRTGIIQIHTFERRRKTV